MKGLNETQTVSAALEHDLIELLPHVDERICNCGCGWGLAGKRAGAKFYNDTHRQAGHRGASVESPRTERDTYYSLTDGEHEYLKRRLAQCRCNGHHLLDGDDGNCLKCGLPYRDNIPPYYERVWEQAARRHSPIPSHLGRLRATEVTA